MAKRISDALMGGFSGGGAGASALGGLGQAGLITGAAVSPWAWGLIGGGAALGGISSLLSEDDGPTAEERQNMRLSNELLGEQLKEKKDAGRARRTTERQRKQFSGTLGSMFAGSKLAGGI